MKNNLVRYCSVFLVIIFFCLAFTQVKKTDIVDKIEWELKWQEDFNEDSLDTCVWGIMKRRQDASRKYHSGNPACYEFKDGKLVIRGIRNPDIIADTAEYLTGAITTEGKKAFSPPAKIEIRAKLGEAKGAWPAIWMLPFKKENGWPDDGEIDIMEHLNYDNIVFQSLHSAYTKTVGKNHPKRYVRPETEVEEFNVYGVEILSDYIRFTVNDKETLYYPKVDSLLNKGEFPFFRDWYLMLDMQIGGSWVGPVDPNDFPVEMEIDWVKYYRPKK